MKKYASYNHLRKCDIGSWQGIFRGNRFDKNVVEAIEYVQSTIGIRRNGADVFTAVYCQLLTDFLFHKISVPEKKATRLRILKNKIKVPRRIIASEWVSKKQAAILELLDLLKYPLREEGEGEIPVGPFTLKNPISLSEDKIAMMEGACKEALRLCTNSLAPGFTKALYGDVILVEKLGRASWYAWYNGAKDEVTLKFFDRDKKEFMKTFIHEVGHRYYQKILPREKKSLWRSYDTRCHLTKNIDLNDWVGVDIGLYATKKRKKTSIGSKGDMKAVIKAVLGPVVYLEWENGGSGTFRKKYMKDFIKSRTGLFPTNYATTDPEEHFCEALSYKALGDLHPKSLEAFNSIIVDGVRYEPDASNFKEQFVPEQLEAPEAPAPTKPTPTKPTPGTTPAPGLTETAPPAAPKTQVKETLPSKPEMVRSSESLASRLGLLFNKGRKYGRFIYTNDAVGSTHAYMFIDYSTGNLFAPKKNDAPNLKVNIGNITDDNLDMNVGFERMSSLRPRWRTMNVITEPTKKAPTTEVIDQTPEPMIPTTPEGNLESIVKAAQGLASSLGLTSEIMRKFIRVVYTNPDQGTRHAYLFVDKQTGTVYLPKYFDFANKNVSFGSILEPGIVSKVNFEAMNTVNPKWRTKSVITR